MHLIFTKHFQDMVVDRNINIDHMKKSIINPDFAYRTSDGKIVARKSFNDTVLEVVYIKDFFGKAREQYRIITAYYID